MSKTETLCPISADRIEQNTVRAIAFLVIVLTGFTLIVPNYISGTLLLIDFSLRAFNKGKGSILKLIATGIVNLLQLKKLPVDAAPKRFAAALGIIFSVFILLFQSLNYTLLSHITGGLLICCAFLESAFNFCAGCLIYTWIIVPFLKPHAELNTPDTNEAQKQ